MAAAGHRLSGPLGRLRRKHRVYAARHASSVWDRFGSHQRCGGGVGCCLAPTRSGGARRLGATVLIFTTGRTRAPTRPPGCSVGYRGDQRPPSASCIAAGNRRLKRPRRGRPTLLRLDSVRRLDDVQVTILPHFDLSRHNLICRMMLGPRRCFLGCRMDSMFPLGPLLGNANHRHVPQRELGVGIVSADLLPDLVGRGRRSSRGARGCWSAVMTSRKAATTRTPESYVQNR